MKEHLSGQVVDGMFVCPCGWAISLRKFDTVSEEIVKSHAVLHRPMSRLVRDFASEYLLGAMKYRISGGRVMNDVLAVATWVLVLPAFGAVMAVAVWGSVC